MLAYAQHATFRRIKAENKRRQVGPSESKKTQTVYSERERQVFSVSNLQRRTPRELILSRQTKLGGHQIAVQGLSYPNCDCQPQRAEYLQDTKGIYAPNAGIGPGAFQGEGSGCFAEAVEGRALLGATDGEQGHKARFTKKATSLCNVRENGKTHGASSRLQGPVASAVALLRMPREQVITRVWLISFRRLGGDRG